MCDSKKLRFVKKQKSNGLSVGFLGVKSPFEGIPILKNIIQRHKMNDIVNKFLLARHKFMLEIHLRQPGFTYSDCGPFTKNKE